VSASDLPVRLADLVPETEANAVRGTVARRRAGEPLQYVLGTWAFRTLEVVVDRRVLVPRPETEVVTGAALEELSRRATRLAPGARAVAVDMGTGSGVIALSLAAEWPSVAPTGPRPELEVWATDVSSAALEVTQSNLAALHHRDPVAARRVRVTSGSWFEALPPVLRGTIDLIVSNPPYVAAGEWPGLDVGVRDHEPKVALVAGPTGREALETLLVGARRWLSPGGILVVELAPPQATVLGHLAARLGYVAPEIRSDLAGRARILVARRRDGEPR
jgi:release factor glutamine methyltransferase